MDIEELYIDNMSVKIKWNQIVIATKEAMTFPSSSFS